MSQKLFQKKAGCSLDNRTKSYHLYLASKEIHTLLQSLGIPRGNKTVHPINDELFLSVKQNEIKSFLIGVINGDGSISNKKSGGSIDIVTGNESTAVLYSTLLRRIGVISSVHTVKNQGGGVVRKGEFKISKVTVTGVSNIKLLFDERLTNKKRESLLKIVKRKDTSWRIPKISSLLHNLHEKIPWFEKKTLYSNSIRMSRVLSKSKFSREVIQQCINDLTVCNPANKTPEFKLLKDVIEQKLMFPKITSITKIEKLTTVYNIQIDRSDSPNFIANFIVVHNCMIDEMDKMSEDDRSAMHEALEQQTVSISKANIQATLRWETTVLAAANPKFGRFDPYENLAKQIDMPPALINRFDLIFPIKDVPDTIKDEKMATHILNLHQTPDIGETDIPTDLLRKFISYARQKIKPVLTDGALEEIKKYYVEMRNSSGEDKGMKPVPISARQLEALVRLSESSAKLRLSDKVTRKDAKRGVDILHYCLSQIGIDPETGKIDMDKISTGITASQRGKIGAIKEILVELEKQIGKAIPIEDVISTANQRGIEDAEVEEVIEKLKRAGDIFEPRRGFLSRI